MGRRGAGAQRSVAAWQRDGVAAERCIAGAERITGRAWQQQAADHRQQAASIGAGDPLAGRGSSRQPITGRAWQQQAADHRQGAAAAGSRSHR